MNNNVLSVEIIVEKQAKQFFLPSFTYLTVVTQLLSLVQEDSQSAEVVHILSLPSDIFSKREKNIFVDDKTFHRK